ncbi:MAG: DUF2182 domain-containing protein [Dokdonella sp.]|uniref:DUF2182 domain-containing protein n=1 Tax=Dokdonella sp. TaxID=2291710 RepID=UPI003267DA4C
MNTHRPDPAQTRTGSRTATPGRMFIAVTLLVFAASMAATVAGCLSMSAMDSMPMAGGWSMSMAWMRMPGRSWLETAASFVGMWGVMMIAMMLPSITPMLMRYRSALDGAGEHRVDLLPALAAAGYVLVWAMLGAALFVPGAVLATVAMRHPSLARAMPLAAGIVVALAGALQLTRWKARRLACCREAVPWESLLKANAGTALRHGVRLGLQCTACCASPTAVLLALGVMDARAMAGVTAAIALERLTPAGPRFARVIGGIAIAAGLLLVVRALARD